MSGSINRVTLIGNVGKDPEIRRFDSGDSVVNLMDIHHADLPAIVRQRMKEAAATERRLPESSHGDGPRRAALTFWPHAAFTPEDMAGWTNTERAEFAEERRNAPRSASPREVSGWEEALSWLPHIRRACDRDALLAWARCAAAGWSFRAWCRKHGIGETMTGHRRVTRAVEDIVRRIANNPEMLAARSDFSVMTDQADFGIECGIIAEVVQDTPRVTAWLAEDARPVPADYSDPDAVAAFEAALEASNERARRRRAKLGVIDEVS